MDAVRKNRSSFISMCLRSVHSLHSLRFGGQRSFLTAIHPSLHCVQFISPTSALHGISGFLIPRLKSNPHSIPLHGCFYPLTLKTLHTLQVLQPSTHKSTQGSSITYQPIEPLHSITTYATFQRISNGIFFPQRRVYPINRLKAER